MKELKSLPDDGLRKLALHIIEGRIFTSDHLKEYEADLIPNIFMPVIFGAAEEYGDQIGMIYANYKDSSGMAVDHIYVFVTIDEHGKEGIAASFNQRTKMWLPLVAYENKNLEICKKLAKDFVEETV